MYHFTIVIFGSILSTDKSELGKIEVGRGI